MAKLFKIWSRDPILKNLSKYHVLLSFFEFWISIIITYFSHLSPLSISIFNHFSPYLSTPLSLILPYLAIFQSMEGGRTPTTPPLIPFFFFPFFSPFLVTILSHISVVHGSSSPPTFSSHEFVLTLSHFFSFAASFPHSPFCVTFTLHPKIYDLHFNHQPCHKWLQSISFLLHASLTNRSSTLSTFFIIYTTMVSRVPMLAGS
jgi:hypothetical protein